MRILQISSARDYGGGERHVRDLSRGLVERGHDVFAALRPTNTWESQLDFLPPGNILHTSIRNSFGILSSKRIAAYVRANEIDIVHAHVARDYIPASIACGLAKPAKFILTRHVLFELKAFNKFALKNLSRAIAVSPGVEFNLRRTFPANKVSLVLNGIDASVSAESRMQMREEFRGFHSIPFDVPLIGTLGELIELKGQREFVMAAHEVSKQFPDARFVVVGKDHSIDKKFRRELRRLASVFGIGDRFLWLDWLEDTSPFYAALDLFVSASHSESFGLAILEAMAGSTAVIATETEGAKELLSDNTLLTPVNDAVGLARSISAMIGDKQRIESTGRRLAERAAEKFSAARMIEETEKIYLRSISGEAD